MSSRDFDYFMAIAETGSISKAAERLYISQPSLSKYLKRLEGNLGIELFHRGSYPLTLTEAGEIYQKYVQSSIAREKLLQRDFSNLKKPTSGTVTMGLTVWRSSVLLPVVLPLFWHRYPDIQIQVQEGSHQFLASLMDHDKLDFALMHLPNKYENSAMAYEHLMDENIIFVVNRSSPVMEKLPPYNGPQHLSNEQFRLFRDEFFIMPNEAQNIYEVTGNYLERLGIVPKVRISTANIVAAVKLVEANLGVVFAPGLIVRGGHIPENLAFFTVGDPPLGWEIAIAYKKERLPCHQARLFIKCIESCFGDGKTQ